MIIQYNYNPWELSINELNNKILELETNHNNQWQLLYQLDVLKQIRAFKSL